MSNFMFKKISWFKFFSFLFLFNNCTFLTALESFALSKNELALAYSIARKRVKDEVYDCFDCLLGANPGDAHRVQLCAYHHNLFRNGVQKNARKIYFIRRDLKSLAPDTEASRGSKRPYGPDPFQEEYLKKISEAESKSARLAIDSQFFSDTLLESTETRAVSKLPSTVELDAIFTN